MKSDRNFERWRRKVCVRVVESIDSHSIELFITRFYASKEALEEFKEIGTEFIGQ